MTASALRTRVKHGLTRAVLGLPAPVLRRLGGAPVQRDGQTLDPQIQLLLRLNKSARWPLSVAVARRQLEADGNALAPPAPTDVAAGDYHLDGPAGQIPLRLYRPRGLATPMPALVFYHGGGFVRGSLDSHDPSCRQLAARAGCVVISVAYRLAPEHRFPAGLEDALTAFRTVAAHAGALGLDPHRLAVGGDSAGGNLAAVVAQQTRDDAVPPCLQLLWYPWVDLGTWRPSGDMFAQGFQLERPMLQWFLECYLADPAQARDPRASPLLGDLAGVAPAFVLTGGFDPLRDEGEAYASRLVRAGVPTRLQRYPGLIHGFFNMSGSIDAAKRAFEDAAQTLRGAFSKELH